MFPSPIEYGLLNDQMRWYSLPPSPIASTIVHQPRALASRTTFGLHDHQPIFDVAFPLHLLHTHNGNFMFNVFFFHRLFPGHYFQRI